MAVSSESINALRGKIKFYSDYLKIIPLNRSLEHYEMLWMVLNRFVIRASSGGDIYSLLAECFPRSSSASTKVFSDLDSLLSNIKSLSNKVVYGKTRRDKDLMGYEEIFSSLWGEDETHPSNDFTNTYKSYLHVENQMADFLSSVSYFLNEIGQKRKEKMNA